jgi:hypothetical protein
MRNNRANPRSSATAPQNDENANLRLHCVAELPPAKVSARLSIFPYCICLFGLAERNLSFPAAFGEKRLTVSEKVCRFIRLLHFVGAHDFGNRQSDFLKRRSKNTHSFFFKNSFAS